MYEAITFEKTDGIARLTLNRPDQLNALKARDYDDLTLAVLEATADDEVGVILISGNGRAFCAGGDLKEADVELVSESTSRQQFFRRMILLGEAMLHSSKPVVCAVHGACVGGGAELALFADLVIVDATAYFLFNGTAIGGANWWGAAALLPAKVGLGRAEEILYFSRRVTGAEAVELGLANRLADGDLEEQATRMCNELLNLSEGGIRLTKSALRTTKEMLLVGMTSHAEANVAALESPAFKAARSAFLGDAGLSWRDLRADRAHKEREN